MPKMPTRSRFARLYSDGGMNVSPAEHSFERARKDLIESHDDEDVELLEIEITVIRTHGRPKLHVVREHSARCPCCGELVQIKVQQQGGGDAE